MFKLSQFFSKKNTNSNFKIQSFTYFIPAPPNRGSGYREKQFDKYFYEFINLGFEILEFKTTAISRENSSGMWVVFILKATNEKASKLDLNETFLEKKFEPRKEEVEGLYYIDDQSGEL